MTIGKPMKSKPVPRPLRTARHSNRYVGPVLLLCVLALILQVYWMQQQRAAWSERDTGVAGLDAELIDRLQSRTIHLYECEHCVGNGLVEEAGAPATLCPICFGVGYHPGRMATEAERMCLACGGMGRRFNDAGEVDFCGRCAGRGVIDPEQEAAAAVDAVAPDAE
jgi:hypothetical protein